MDIFFIKFVYSEMATKFDKKNPTIFISNYLLMFLIIIWEIFYNFCVLLRIYDLYMKLRQTNVKLWIRCYQIFTLLNWMYLRKYLLSFSALRISMNLPVIWTFIPHINISILLQIGTLKAQMIDFLFGLNIGIGI